MHSESDVVIVGGGVMGCSTAWWLLGMQPDLSVTVIEQDPTYAHAATALSVASVRSQFTNPVNVQISRFGVEFIRDFATHLGPAGGVPSLGLRENGYLFLAGTDAGAALIADLADMQRSFGAGTMVLTPAALAAQFPWMQFDDVTAGSYGPRDEGWFDNMGMLSGFRNAARQRGARFVTGRVTGFVRDGAQVTGVQTASSTYLADKVLLSAGTGVTDLLRHLDQDWPVEARKRTVFVIDAPNARHPDTPLTIDHTGYYMRPEHDAWIVATVPADDGPCALDDWEADHSQFDDLIWPQLYNRSLGFDAVKVLRNWVGHYDYNTLDQNAAIGLHPRFANLYLASGFSGHGLQQAPAVGRGLAELLLTGAWQTLDLSPLSVNRILENRPFLELAIV